MRTTLEIDDELMRRVRERAQRRNETITKVIEDAVRDALAGEKAKTGGFKLRWVTARGRLLPGVDLADRDALYERMEGRS